MNPSILVILAGLMATQAQALQIVDARDGVTVFAKVSRQEITRIGFEHGRVRKVTGNAGEFILDKDEQRGFLLCVRFGAEQIEVNRLNDLGHLAGCFQGDDGVFKSGLIGIIFNLLNIPFGSILL